MTNQPVTNQSEAPPGDAPPNEVTRTWMGSWLLLAAIALALLLSGVALGAVGNRPGAVRVTATATITVSVAAPAPPVSGPTSVTTFGDGQYQVGVDIPAGNYHTNGGRNCYWERLDNLSGGFTAILANGQSRSPQTVRVLGSDKAFGVKGGCQWALIR